jgi:hypothetical protein
MIQIFKLVQLFKLGCHGLNKCEQSNLNRNFALYDLILTLSRNKKKTK